MGCNQSTPPTRPTSSVPAVEETRYQITFLLEHEIIGEFGEKIITNLLNSSSDSYKKEVKQNVYIKSIHSSVTKYVSYDKIYKFRKLFCYSTKYKQFNIPISLFLNFGHFFFSRRLFKVKSSTLNVRLQNGIAIPVSYI